MKIRRRRETSRVVYPGLPGWLCDDLENPTTRSLDLDRFPYAAIKLVVGWTIRESFVSACYFVP